jgi:hypothetical protein
LHDLPLAPHRQCWAIKEGSAEMIYGPSVEKAGMTIVVAIAVPRPLGSFRTERAIGSMGRFRKIHALRALFELHATVADGMI